MTATPIQEKAQSIARLADIYVTAASYEPQEALDLAARTISKSASLAFARRLPFGGPMTTEQREEWRILGQTALDVLDGTVSRPSTGNVRQYALQRIRSAAA